MNTTTKNLKTLDGGLLKALHSMIVAHGRNWKQEVRLMWSSGRRSQGIDGVDQGALQLLRNVSWGGFAWLESVTTAAIQAEHADRVRWHTDPFA